MLNQQAVDSVDNRFSARSCCDSLAARHQTATGIGLGNPNEMGRLRLSPLRDIFKQARLDGRHGSSFTRHGWKDDGGADLIGALNEAYRQLRAKRHDGPAPGLAGGGIPEIVRLKVITKIVNEALCPLGIDIQIAGPRKTEQRRHAAVKRAHPRDGLGRRRLALYQSNCRRDQEQSR